LADGCAGKSSLLKACIIPRLCREAPTWLSLRAFRPGADPPLNFAEHWRGRLPTSVETKRMASSATGYWRLVERRAPMTPDCSVLGIFPSEDAIFASSAQSCSSETMSGQFCADAT
jgi:hypothetical protein